MAVFEFLGWFPHNPAIHSASTPRQRCWWFDHASSNRINLTLKCIKVLEFAGLAPGPFAGLLLADFGATVLRIDRPDARPEPPPTTDLLTRHKSSIAVDLKSPSGVALIKVLISSVDIVIDPFRPGVLEKAGLSPEKVLLRLNPRLIVGRMTGFRREGKYSAMAGHDINYLAVSGILSLLGRRDEKPYAPANVLGDFAGGGLVCFLGIVLALLQRMSTGCGQVVEANMVDGAAYLSTFPRLLLDRPIWDQPRGSNTLDGGCPYYDTYETKDGKYMAVGALEPQFFSALCKGLNVDPNTFGGSREDRKNWPHIKDLFTKTFLSKPRSEWEKTFDGTDACVTPVLTYQELAESKYDQRPIVTLKDSPSKAISDSDLEQRPVEEGQGIGVEGEGWTSKGLRPGEGGEELLARWMGWQQGRHYIVKRGGLEKLERDAKL